MAHCPVVTLQPVLRAVERQAKLTIYVNPYYCTNMPYFVSIYVLRVKFRVLVCLLPYTLPLINRPNGLDQG